MPPDHQIRQGSDDELPLGKLHAYDNDTIRRRLMTAVEVLVAARPIES